MNNNLLVSVIVPNYNHAKYLDERLSSIINQTYEKLEILVVNDNENDDDYTKELKSIMSTVTDPRVQLVFQEKHINGAAARNYGCKKARGEFIAFLDDDDTWEKTKIEKQVKRFNNLSTDYGLVTCLAKTYYCDELLSFYFHTIDGILFDILTRNTGIGLDAALIKHDAFNKVGGFDERLNRGQDLQLFSNLAVYYKVCLIKEYLLNIYADDPQNRSNGKNVIKRKKEYLKSIENVLENLEKKDKEVVLIMHGFEDSLVLIKSGYKKEAFIYCLCVFKHRKSFILAIKRITDRLRGKYLKKMLINKYKSKEV